MASYASVTSSKSNRLKCILDLHVYMDPTESFNKKYQENRAQEKYEKESLIIGKNKINSLTYNKKGNWVMELKRKEDAIHVSESTIQLSGSNQNINLKIRSDIGLLITVKCDPLVEDHDILSELDPFIREVYSITHTTYKFDRNLKDGRRLFRVNPKVKLEEIPHTIEIGGIKIALHYAGKSFLCSTCQYSHPPQQQCIARKPTEKPTAETIPNKHHNKYKNESNDFVSSYQLAENNNELTLKLSESKVTKIAPTEPAFEIVKSKSQKKEERKIKKTINKQNEFSDIESEMEEGEIRQNDKNIYKKNAPPPTPQKIDPKRLPRKKADGY
ncbi:uncharacterized protein LOC136075453 [Hydra vulgaris]|uniref:Uncharacterized protein LOC136075453 n=1 Tax=Hydra vulgaris TaxID=6087 RepID=A0ABM4B7D5_HYDVU